MTLIERIVLHNTITELYTQLQATQAMYTKQLQEKPFDINIQSAMKKVDNDLQLIEPLVKQTGVEVYKSIETIYGKGKKFQFIPTSIEMYE